MKVLDGLHAFIWRSTSANNCNAYLLDGPARVLIDPGHLHLFDHVAVQLRGLGIELCDIDLVIATHAHPDHFEAVKLFKKEPALFAVGIDDWRMIQEIGKHVGPSFDLEAYAPDFFLKEGSLDVEGTKLEIIPTPGHSLGSVSLYWPEKKALFSGDVLFRDCLGRTDLPGGDGESLKKSIKALESFDSELLLSGHGEIVSGRAQVKSNFKRVEELWFGYI